MKEFLYIIRGGDAEAASKSPEEMQKHMQKWQVWMGSLADQGRFIAGQPLMIEGKSIINRGQSVIDRPLSEGKELVGGYILVKAESLEAATDLAKGCPVYEVDGTVEVRELREM